MGPLNSCIRLGFNGSWFFVEPFLANLWTFSFSASVSTETMATACMLVSEGRRSDKGEGVGALCCKLLLDRGDTARIMGKGHQH